MTNQRFEVTDGYADDPTSRDERIIDYHDLSIQFPQLGEFLETTSIDIASDFHMKFNIDLYYCEIKMLSDPPLSRRATKIMEAITASSNNYRALWSIEDYIGRQPQRLFDYGTVSRNPREPKSTAYDKALFSELIDQGYAYELPDLPMRFALTTKGTKLHKEMTDNE